jgi:RNase P subunit RPR2
VSAAPEALAKRRGLCRLCRKPIVPGEHYVTKLRIGWVHSSCGAGYRRVRAENEAAL